MRRTFAFSAFLSIGLFSAIFSSGQGIMIPTNPELNTKEDYAKYESTIVDAAKWLEGTDLDKEEDLRKHVGAFVFKWLSGSPDIHVSLAEPLLKLTGKNSHLLMIYMASASRNLIENKTSPSSFNAVKAGLTSMMSVYKKNIAIKKNKDMDKLIKITEEGKLDEFIKDRCQDLLK